MGIFSSKRKKIIEKSSLCQTILIGGEAGEGIKLAGKISALSLTKSGYNVFIYDEYPSLIRGGHNSVNITYSFYPVYSQNNEIDILVCLNRETFDKHKENLSSTSTVLYDPKDFEITEDDLGQFPCELIEVLASEIIERNKFPKIVANTIFLSTAMLIIGISRDTVISIISKEFSKKRNILELNINAVNQTYLLLTEYTGIKKKEGDINTGMTANDINKFFLTGNEAVALGSIKSGLQFYAAYPMTPASTILDTLFKYYRQYNYVVKQTEDELSAINMAIGAGYAGARVMTGTSGGGFSLMTEGLGLAAITETPIVIVVSQRPGPATGLPTWTGQADLLFVLNASQDEFPRIILTPTDAEEAFYLAFHALNLAEKYQIPVFLLLDRYLSESTYIVSLDNLNTLKVDRGLLLNDRMLTRLDDFNRYEITSSGISPRSIPGQVNGIFLANSDEGNTKGYSSENAANRKAKVDKRFRKVEHIVKDLPEVNMYGNSRSKVGIICWGSTKGPILEAMRRLQTQGTEIKLLALNYVEPFPKEEIVKFITIAKEIVVIEGNSTSQLSKLINMNTNYTIDKQLLKYDGRPFNPAEIVTYISNL